MSRVKTGKELSHSESACIYFCFVKMFFIKMLPFCDGSMAHHLECAYLTVYMSVCVMSLKYAFTPQIFLKT